VTIAVGVSVRRVAAETGMAFLLPFAHRFTHVSFRLAKKPLIAPALVTVVFSGAAKR
jgi:hypothetical protein